MKNPKLLVLALIVCFCALLSLSPMLINRSANPSLAMVGSINHFNPATNVKVFEDVGKIWTEPRNEFNLSDTLAALADNNNLNISSVVAHWETNDPLYLRTALRELNTFVVGYEGSWDYMHPERDRYRFDEVDNLIRMAKAHNKSVIWGPFVLWCTGYPEWLATYIPGSIDQETHFNRTELLDILDDHIETVIGRYKDDVDAWYIGNELIHSPAYFEAPYTYDNYTTELRHTFWYDVIGSDYIAYAFNKTREVAPEAKLFLNDAFWWGENPKLAEARCDFFYDLVVDLLAQGVPLDGVGLQYYAEVEVVVRNPADQTSDLYFRDEIWEQRHQEIQRFLDLGIEVHISETGIRIWDPVTPEELQGQAEIYQKTLELALQYENVTTFIPFGLTDKTAIYFQPGEASYLFDMNIEPRPAYYALKHRLRGNTTLYQHDFGNPAINPPADLTPDMDWGCEPLVTCKYKVCTADFNGTGSWEITKGGWHPATLDPGNIFWVNISRFPVDEVYWNESNYFDIAISGDGIDGVLEGDYSFWDCTHFIRYIWHPTTLEWLRKIIPEGSRLTWDDWILIVEEHSEYWFADPDPTVTNNYTHFGYSLSNENASLHMEWRKSTGILEYYHYIGSDFPGQLPLDLEFILETYAHIPFTTTFGTTTSTTSETTSIIPSPSFEWIVVVYLVSVGLTLLSRRKKKMMQKT
ncbi:MAG: endo-1,4-beta-xylanase [Candidatus Hermodarchaeota archaeon]